MESIVTPVILGSMWTGREGVRRVRWWLTVFSALVLLSVPCVMGLISSIRHWGNVGRVMRPCPAVWIVIPKLCVWRVPWISTLMGPIVCCVVLRWLHVFSVMLRQLVKFVALEPSWMLLQNAKPALLLCLDVSNARLDQFAQNATSATFW